MACKASECLYLDTPFAENDLQPNPDISGIGACRECWILLAVLD